MSDVTQDPKEENVPAQTAGPDCDGEGPASDEDRPGTDPGLASADVVPDDRVESLDISESDEANTEKIAADVTQGEGEDEGEDAQPGPDIERWRIPKAELKQVIEGMLFVSGRVLTESMLGKAVAAARKSEIREVLDELMAEWSDPLRGMHLMEINNGFQFRSDAACAPYIREMLKARPTRLSKPALESLAIIAYRQPVTRADIEDIRGVDSGAVIKTLLDKKLIKVLGKREEPGRPMIYGTSKEFLETFHIRSLKDLPTLQEYQELTEEHRAMVESTYSRDEVSQAEEEQDQLFILPERNADESPVARDLLQAAEDLEMAVRQVDETVTEVLSRVPYDELDDAAGEDAEVMGQVEIIAVPDAPVKARRPDDLLLVGDADEAGQQWQEPEYDREESSQADDEEPM